MGLPQIGDERNIIRNYYDDKQGSGFGAYFRILRDRETGVEYLFMGEGYGAGLTPLLDASGRPVVSSYTGHGGEDVKY